MSSDLSPLAEELNDSLCESNPAVFSLLSSYGKRLFFPKGIISQSLEAKEKASLFNATIGIAKENHKAMMLPSFGGLISSRIEAHKILPYAPSGGLKVLRELWQKRQKKVNPSLGETSLPVVTSGLTHGLSLAGELFLDEGDTVVLPNMFWGNYKLIWQVKGRANFVSYPFFDKEFSHFNFEGFKKALLGVSSKKIFISLNLPHNPTGYSLSFNEAKEVLNFIKGLAQTGREIIAVCDDAYAGLVYEEGFRGESLFSELANLHPNILAVKIDGCTKEFFMWGMRVGFLTFGSKGLTKKACYALERKASAALRAGISSVTNHSQEVLKELLLKEEVVSEAGEKNKLLLGRYQEVKKEVYKKEYKDLWEVYPFNSGYFMCLKLKNNLDSEKLRLHLLDAYGVGIISLGNSNIRVAFSCVEKEEMASLFERIADGIKSLSS